MRKYDDIISRLTLSQKIKILTSAESLSDKDMNIPGALQINAADMKDYGRGIIPNVTSLAHSWNEELWYSVSKAKTEMMLRDGKNFLLVPGSKIKFSPYRREISEDPYLASAISSAHIKAAADIGVVSAATGLYLTKADTRWLSEKPDTRVIHEFLTAPFKNALVPGSVRVISGDIRETNAEYKHTSRLIADEVFKYSDYAVCKSATDENTVDFIARGIICLEGSEIALEGAVARYKKLKKSIENNEGATQEQLSGELERRSAISTETIDDAVDRLLEFVHTVQIDRELLDKDETDSSALDSLCIKSVIESAVLLKNKNSILPLESASSVAIVGDIAFAQTGGESVADTLSRELGNRGYRVIGAARGYDTNSPHNNRLAEEAVKIASRCDTVLLFLGFGYENEKKIPKTETLSLPANQLYLVSRLLRSNKRVVAVISSGHAPDIDFTRDIDGVLLAPLEVNSSAVALTKMICGDSSPSGKLAYTVYSGADVSFAKAKVYRKKYRMKNGPFIGYRYYDTADLTVGYPFGHGLSYARFKYSDLSVAKDGVTFTVKNVSEFDGVEVAQLYVGEKNPALISPRKELCGFKKVALLAGEKKTVTIPLRFPERYVDGEYVTAGGEYLLSVGSSVSDIRLKTVVSHDGPKLNPDGERACDYLQSVSNVIEDNYTLEANYSVMKKSIRNILFGIAFVVLAISAAVFNLTTKYPSTFVGVLAGILATVAAVFFVSEAVVRSRLYAEERRRIQEANDEKFEMAEQIPVLSTAKMFRDEFEIEETENAAGAELVEEIGEENVSQYIDKEFTFQNAVSDLKTLLDSRGYRVAATVAENLMSSLATSRLIVTGAMESDSFCGFVRVISEYFGTEVFLDRAEKRSDTDTSFFAFDYHGDHTKKNILLAIEYARENPMKTVVVALDGATAAMVEEHLAPFTKYLYSPKAMNKISIVSENGAEINYNISPNLRFIINLSDKTSLDSLAPHLSSLAAVNMLDYEICQINEAFTGVRELNRYQLDYMRDKECAKADVSEDVWKKIDKLEKYAARFSDYRIGNKLWLGFEKHVGMLLASGLTMIETVDVSIASRLVFSLAVALKDNIPEGEQTLPESLEFIFGEENADFSKNVISKMIFEVEEEIAEEAPAEETPVEETPAEEAPVEEAIAEETPVEETPAEEAPVEETPVEEAPAEENSDMQNTLNNEEQADDVN